VSLPPASRPAILAGIRVLDLSHQYSGAHAASMLADLGADVICVEHPGGSPIRTMLPKKGEHSLWWKVAQRGKRNVSLRLSHPEGRDLLLKMAPRFDVMVENFRPGTLERWGIGPDDLARAGANLALLRISGFGQTGPYRDRPGFGSIAEAMSGFAHLNGFPDQPPAFPSTTLADGVASVFGVMGVLAALVGRLREGLQGVEVVDVALFESLFRIIPTQVAGYDQLGKVPKRPGNFLGEHGVLRNVYRTADDRYLTLSSVGGQAIRRIIAGAGATELCARIDAGVMERPMSEVQAFLTDCDVHLGAWARARPYAELVADLVAAGAVHGPVYDVADIVADPHYLARGDVIEVPDDDLGTIRMQGVVPKFPGRDHKVKHAGRRRGANNAEVYRELLGLGADDLARLEKEGVI